MDKTALLALLHQAFELVHFMDEEQLPILGRFLQKLELELGESLAVQMISFDTHEPKIPIALSIEKLRKTMKWRWELLTKPSVVDSLNYAWIPDSREVLRELRCKEDMMTEEEFLAYAQKKFDIFPFPISLAHGKPQEFPPEVLTKWEGEYMAPSYLVEFLSFKKRKRAIKLVEQLAKVIDADSSPP